MWSQFSRLSTIVRANSIEQAEIRFWASRESDNAQYIIDIQ